MRNPFTCDNCIFNPSQFQELGTKVGFCLKHEVILKNASHTTCHFHRRKDLPYFLAEEGQREHEEQFAEKAPSGIVYYSDHSPEQLRLYSEKYCWLTRTFDPYLHDVAIYHRTVKKWTFIQALAGARSPIKSIMHSCMVRRYIFQCGPEQDNYRLILGLSASLGERVELSQSDFRFEVIPDEFLDLRKNYIREVILLRLYAIQEYGHLTRSENIMWASDELNGSFLSSEREYLEAVRGLVPLVQTWIVEHAQARGTFFAHPEDEEPNAFDGVDQKSKS